jgi:hypothetical protein
MYKCIGLLMKIGVVFAAGRIYAECEDSGSNPVRRILGESHAQMRPSARSRVRGGGHHHSFRRQGEAGSGHRGSKEFRGVFSGRTDALGGIDPEASGQAGKKEENVIYVRSFSLFMAQCDPGRSGIALSF